MKLSIKNLGRVYRDADRALSVISGLDYQFPEKGSVAIVGRSGVGKSTLLHMLGGLDRPNAGSVFYDQTALEDLSEDQLAEFRGRNIGFVFQFHHLLPEFSALENVAMPLLIAGVSANQAQARGRELLGRLGLKGREGHNPGQLSGGEQQRVAIARAVVANPSALLADEPTGNLDLQTAREVQAVLHEINRELGNLMVVVTHNPELAESMDLVLEMGVGGSLQVKS